MNWILLQFPFWQNFPLGAVVGPVASALGGGAAPQPTKSETDQQDSSLPWTNQIRGSSILRTRSSLPVRAPKNLSASSNFFLFLFLFSVKLYGLGPDKSVPSSVRVRKCWPPRVLTHKSQPLILRVQQTASACYLFTRFSHPARGRRILRKP